MARMQMRTWYIALLVAVLCTLGTSAVPVSGPKLSQIRDTIPNPTNGTGGEAVPAASKLGSNNPFGGPPAEFDPGTLKNIQGCVVNFYIFNGLHSQGSFQTRS
jgi:hypothetical protein